MSDLSQVFLFLISLAANLFSAFAGGGAGLVQLPALLFLGLPFPVALATHKVASVALGVGATLRHLKAGKLNLPFALFILACGMPGVVLGAHLVLQVPPHISQLALGILTIGLGLYSLTKKELGLHDRPTHRDRKGYILGGIVLFLMGGLNGSLTSGTGLFVTLWLIRWFGFEYKQAVAYTLILVGLFWNGAGAVALGVQGQIQWDWIPALLLGSLIGGFFGAHWALKKGSRWIKTAYEIITLAVGVSLLIKL